MRERSLSPLAVALAAGLAAAPAPAFAQAGPAARMDAVLGASGDFPELPPLARISAPAAAAAVAVPSAVDGSASVVPPGLWTTLVAPDAATLSWLSSRIPGLNAAAVRQLTPTDADALFATAAQRAESPLDFFSDPAFRGADVYYVPQDVIAALFSRYEIRVLTPSSGTTTDGRPFAMQALVIGGGRVDTLYDQDNFSANNPMFPDYTYQFAGHVTEAINGPGDLSVSGVWVHVGFVTPQIQRIVKLSATQARVDSNYGSRVKPISPITRR
ncbi:MAG: hypothetical protein HKL90_04925 [Elusimicrobia bacterium]|nr:hypothetical protein [Elusimicrobiota bacterium]